MKLALVDLDGVVANVDERFKRAEEAKQAWLNDIQNVLKSEREATNLYWREVFNPEHVQYDTLIDGAKEALESLRYQQGYELLFVTSRPESMRQATQAWLLQHGILFFFMERPALLMKAPAFQYTKTTVWKAGIVQTLASLYSVDEVLFIDDEDKNISALLEAYPDGQPFSFHCFNSLTEVVEWLSIPTPTLPDEPGDEDPFSPA